MSPDTQRDLDLMCLVADRELRKGTSIFRRLFPRKCILCEEPVNDAYFGCHPECYQRHIAEKAIDSDSKRRDVQAWA